MSDTLEWIAPRWDTVLAYGLQLGAVVFYAFSKPRRFWIDCLVVACAAILFRRALGDLMDAGLIDRRGWASVHRACYVGISGALCVSALWRWRYGRRGQETP